MLCCANGGYKVTLTTDESRVNTVVVGLPQTLIDLGRMTVLPGMTDEQLLQYLNERANISQVNNSLNFIFLLF